MLVRALSLFPLSSVLLFALYEGHAETTNDLAVIVNRANAIVSLSSRDLRSVFLGTKESWPDGTKVLAVSLPSERPETRAILKEVCGMSEADFKRYFLMMNFQGKSVSPPRMMQNADAVKAFVGATPGALGVIRLRDVDSSVAIMSIDGVRPWSIGLQALFHALAGAG